MGNALQIERGSFYKLPLSPLSERNIFFQAVYYVVWRQICSNCNYNNCIISYEVKRDAVELYRDTKHH